MGEIVTSGKPNAAGQVLALCRVPEWGQWAIMVFDTTACIHARGIRRFPLAERGAAVLAYYDYQSAHYRGEIMSRAASCPSCGEAWETRLVWGDDDYIHCATCGTAYLPYTEGKDTERKEYTLDELIAMWPSHYKAHHDTYHGVWRCGWCGGALDVTRPGRIVCRCGQTYQVGHDEGGQVVGVEWVRPKEAEDETGKHGKGGQSEAVQHGHGGASR